MLTFFVPDSFSHSFHRLTFLSHRLARGFRFTKKRTVAVYNSPFLINTLFYTMEDFYFI